ncbi:MAG TPA: DUF3365 domain-containing protein [Campylobacterales bacterium]|nr:DUF3365 domain-containing protein [Campylobacterales bacterium]HHS91765.1 DUF3365 domain-containing protein [Campylobacterales bacterium]
MKKRLLSLAILTPLIYSACNSTTVSDAPKVEKELTTVTKEVKQDKKVENSIVKTSSGETSLTRVNYITDKPLIAEEGMFHIKTFMGTLKPTLMNLMKMDDTYVTALGGCSSMAINMTQEYSEPHPNINLRRTAQRYRNPANIPDKTDGIVMENFIQSKNFKKPLVVEMNDHYRVYKALDMQKPCLACHGDIEKMSPKLVKMIDKIYPKDLATGLKLGEFRGVVVAEIKK